MTFCFSFLLPVYRGVREGEDSIFRMERTQKTCRALEHIIGGRPSIQAPLSETVPCKLRLPELVPTGKSSVVLSAAARWSSELVWISAHLRLACVLAFFWAKDFTIKTFAFCCFQKKAEVSCHGDSNVFFIRGRSYF